MVKGLNITYNPLHYTWGKAFLVPYWLFQIQKRKGNEDEALKGMNLSAVLWHGRISQCGCTFLIQALKYVLSITDARNLNDWLLRRAQKTCRRHRLVKTVEMQSELNFKEHINKQFPIANVLIKGSSIKWNLKCKMIHSFEALRKHTDQISWSKHLLQTTWKSLQKV